MQYFIVGALIVWLILVFSGVTQRNKRVSWEWEDTSPLIPQLYFFWHCFGLVACPCGSVIYFVYYPTALYPKELSVKQWTFSLLEVTALCEQHDGPNAFPVKNTYKRIINQDQGSVSCLWGPALNAVGVTYLMKS